MDFYDATTLMRLVQAVENDPYVSSGAGEALADKVREFIEDEAEMGGWYTELMNAIGEGEITDPLADFTVGRFRVHLVQEGERYGAGGGFVYGKALSNDCQLYGHGLPLVEFYDVSQDPAKFPEGQFVSRYFMSTLLGMDSILDVHLLAIERVAPDARVLRLRLVPVLHEHKDGISPDDGGAGLEDGTTHVIPVRANSAILEEDEINAILGLVLHREAKPVEDAARPLLLGIEPELTALRLHVVIPGKRLPHASVQRQLDEPAVILPLDGEDALQQDRLVLPLNLPPPVALRLEHVGSFLSVACTLIISMCRTTNVVNYIPTYALHSRPLREHGS